MASGDHDRSSDAAAPTFEPGGPEMLDGRWRLLKVTTKRRVDATPEDVWSVLADHSTWTAWQEDYEQHDPLTARTTGLGARFNTKEWVLRSEVEIVRWEPGRAIGTTVLRASSLRWLIRRYYTELTIEPIDGDHTACVVHYRTAFTGTWAFWLLSAYTVGQTLGSIYFDSRASLKNLERYLRASGSPHRR